MLAPGRSVELAIEKPAAGGRMIARLDGQIVLVAGTIPGERVTARIERVGKGVAYAETTAVVEPSPDRRPPFTDPQCGGCLYAHVAYPRQLEIKSQVIADAFARIGHLQMPGPVRVAASPDEGYRMRARLHVRGHRIGFFREGTHDLCDARSTRQLLPATCDTLDRLAAAMRSLGLDTVREVELSENVDASNRAASLDTTSPIDARSLERLATTEGLTAFGPGAFVTDVLDVGGPQPLTLRRHVTAFFQGNRFLIRDLVLHVNQFVPAGGDVVDLYAGAGLFSIAAALARGARVTAVEGDRASAADLMTNAAPHELVVPRHQAVETFLASSHPEPAALIVDPPRTGMSREAMDGVLRLGAGRIVYVSCDVATLARDSRRLVDAGYAIERADAFDLFPNTPHVETVVVMQRNRAGATGSGR